MKIELMCLATVLYAVLNSNPLFAASQVDPPTVVAPQSASNPAEDAGLAVVVQPLKDTFLQGEPLAIKLTFQNISKEAFRLPNPVNPAPTYYWRLQVTNVATGKTYTGVTTLNGGAAPEPSDFHPVAVAPGETLTTTATLKRYGYLEGALDYKAAHSQLFHQAMAAREANRGSAGIFTGPQLPAGTYKVSVNVHFASIPPLRPNAPERSRAAQERIAADPTPFWKAEDILSNPVEIKIVAAPEASPGQAAKPVHP